MYLRRLASALAVVASTVILVPLAPFLLSIAYVLAKTTAWRSLHQALLFAYGFLYYEWAGVCALIYTGLRHRNTDTVQRLAYEIQHWWAQGLFAMGRYLFDLRFKLHGVDALNGPGAIIISRHTNIVDNFFPLIYISNPAKPVRYILKQELKNILSLDIGGHRLPNLFVDRSGLQTAKELERVSTLLTSCRAEDSVLIYPEGTRYSAEKHQILSRNPALKEQTQRWPDLLPPRLGGVSALLEANTAKDVICLCHTGFEGSGTIKDFIDGSWLQKEVFLYFWRVSFAKIDADPKEFIFSQWDRMQQTLSRRENKPSEILRNTPNA